MAKKRKKNSDILDMIFNDDSGATTPDEPQKAPEKPKKRRRRKKKEPEPIKVNRTRVNTNEEVFKKIPIQLINKDETVNLSKVDTKKKPHSLQEFCDIFGVEYNGRHRADLPHGILVGLYDDLFNVYLNEEKVGTYKKKDVVRQVKDLLTEQKEASK
jgi:hypothetical protein